MLPAQTSERCVVLPCGGTGERLGLPYPKELHFVLPGKAMIDLTLDRLAPLDPPPRIVLVVGHGRAPVIRRVRQRYRALRVETVKQIHSGFVGAIRSAIDAISATNLLLLPDQAVDDEGAIGRAFSALERGVPAIFLAHRRSAAELADEGALRIAEDRVSAIAEKPGPAAATYDAAWCGLGFRREAALPLLESLEKLYAHGTLDGAEWARSPMHWAPVLFVRDFVDLGVWDRLATFQRQRL